jgi:hypothetical protein
MPPAQAVDRPRHWPPTDGCGQAPPLARSGVDPVFVAMDETHVRALAAARGGIVSRAEVLAAGFTWRSIATRVERGSWARAGKVIILRDLHKPGDRSHAWLLHLHAGPCSIISGPLAARLQRWDIGGADDVVISPVPVRPLEGHGFRVLRRSRARTSSASGLPPLAPRLDALVDTLVCRSPRGAIALLDHALQQRWIDVSDLETALAHRSGPGPRGAGRLRELLARAASGSRSEAEQRMRGILTPWTSSWIANYPLRDERGAVVAEIDFAAPSLRIAIEVDGRAFHSDRAAFERDRVRQNLLVLGGWTVLRFTWERIAHDAVNVSLDVAAAMHRALHRTTG